MQRVALQRAAVVVLRDPTPTLYMAGWLAQTKGGQRKYLETKTLLKLCLLLFYLPAVVAASAPVISNQCGSSVTN
jgi:hypothetical protein